jgi:hypothetical protein
MHIFGLEGCRPSRDATTRLPDLPEGWEVGELLSSKRMMAGRSSLMQLHHRNSLFTRILRQCHNDGAETQSSNDSDAAS